MMHTPEFFEKQDISNYLTKLGAWHFKPYMAGFGKSGVPDIISCIPLIITPDMVSMRLGLFVSAEVKREGKKPTVLQMVRIKEIQEAGGFAVWGTAAQVIPQLQRLPYAVIAR